MGPRTPAGQPRPFVWGARCGGLRGLRRPRPRPSRGGSNPHSPARFGAVGVLPGRTCAAPEPRPELPPARVPPPRGRLPQPERLPGAHRSHHLLRRFTKWPPARSAAPRYRRGWDGDGDVTGEDCAGVLRFSGELPEVPSVCGEDFHLSVYNLSSQPKPEANYQLGARVPPSDPHCGALGRFLQFFQLLRKEGNRAYLADLF